MREKTELKILIFIGVSNIRSYYLHCRNVRISGTQWDILISKVINPLSGIVAKFVWQRKVGKFCRVQENL